VFTQTIIMMHFGNGDKPNSPVVYLALLMCTL